MLVSAAAPARVPESTSISLPADFSAEQDVLVLAGSSAAGLLPELERHGLSRVVVYAPGDAAPLASGLKPARTPADVLARILDFEPPARRITVQRVPSGVSDAQLDTLRKTIEHGGINRTTFATSGPLWVRHALQNLSFLAGSPSVDRLKGCFAGKPAVLVAPGPSLAKNIDVLGGIADRVLIIAGNRALAPLRRAGIVPHLVLVADAMDLSYQLGDGLLDGVPALALDMVSHPAVCALPVQRRFFFSAIAEIQESTLAGLGESGVLVSGGSVATVALTMALHVGCDPIIMVGQDLALSGEQYYIPTAPDGSTRITVENGVGTFEGSSPALRKAMNDAGGIKLGEHSWQHFVEVPGFHGGQVLTSMQFDTYRRWLGEAAREQREHVRLVNCTEGGARIENMEQARLAELVDQLELSPFDAAATLAACHGDEPRKQRQQVVERHIKAMQQALLAASEEVQRCERISHQVERAPHELERLDKAEQKLNQAVSKLPFVVALASAEVERARRAGANAKSLVESLRATRALYAVIKQAIALARPALSEALQRVKRAA